MSKKITTLISLKNDSKFKEWVKIFASKEADLRYSKFDIKPLFENLV